MSTARTMAIATLAGCALALAGCSTDAEQPPTSTGTKIATPTPTPTALSPVDQNIADAQAAFTAEVTAENAARQGATG